MFADTDQKSQGSNSVSEFVEPCLIDPILEHSEPEESIYSGFTVAGSRCSEHSDSVITFNKYEAEYHLNPAEPDYTPNDQPPLTSTPIKQKTNEHNMSAIRKAFKRRTVNKNKVQNENQGEFK